jgi:multidrug resistance efflux pump
MRIAAAAGAVAMTLGASIYVAPPAPDHRGREVVVARAPFVESIVETGTVTAARMMLYGAPVGSVPAKIIELAPEGAEVETGDILVRLDTAPLEEMRAREMAALARAEAEVRAAREERHASAAAERLQVMEAEAALAEADREVARARTAVDDLRPMLVQGFITRAELERASQALTRAGDQHRLAAARLELRAFAQGGSPAAGRSGRVDATESQVRELRSRLETLGAQIALSTIRAQRPGLLVYRELFYGTERRKPQVGDDALPNQPLVSVPDSSEFTVQTRVRETDVHRVAGSQRVTIRVDAYPDLRLPGHLDVIGALAQEDGSAAGTKFFPVTVRFDTADPRLRPGMTAQVEIETGAIPSALVVPLEALLHDDLGPHCLVVSAGRAERRNVVVWARNDTHAALKSGLNVGDRLRVPRHTR